MFALNLVVAMKAATATRTANSTSCAREGQLCVLGAVVRSSVGVCRQCRAATTSSTLSARSVVSRCYAALSESSRAGRIVARALYDSVVDEKV